eukprot:GHVU01209600.1.p5 GENE.GHVU01209600.1~~GHVU01209600.1.p5  ORF type:complete len:102 (-),score=17.48 GHVU01209600.1:21-326(-)
MSGRCCAGLLSRGAAASVRERQLQWSPRLEGVKGSRGVVASTEQRVRAVADDGGGRPAGEKAHPSGLPPSMDSEKDQFPPPPFSPPERTNEWMDGWVEEDP